MALQYPGFAAIQPYQQNPDVAGNFTRAFNDVRSIKNEADAEKMYADPNTLSALGSIRSGMPGAPVSVPPQQQQPQMLSDLMQSNDPNTRMVASEHGATQNATDPTLAAYFKSLSQRESGNDPTAQNANSSAGGLFQITDPTWQALVAQNPGSGLTPDGKMDPQQQQIGVRLLTQQNANALSQAGQPVNPPNLYAAHFLGAPEAAKVLGAPDSTPMASLVPADFIQSNPHLADMNVGQFKSWTAQSGTNQNGGYQPPMQGQPAGPGLPSQEVLSQLLQNPVTRDLGLTLLNRQIDPSYQLDIQGKRADIALHTAQADAWSHGGGLAPRGFVYGPRDPVTGVPSLIRMDGGPQDPNINADRPDGRPYGITGSSTIDTSAPDYTTKDVAAGLTQAAVDQRSLSAIISGSPPTGGKGAAGVQAAAIANRMAELDPYGNLAANKTVLKSLSSTLMEQTKYLNNTERSFNTANDTLAALQTYMTKNNINPSQFPDYNSFTNFLKAHGADPGAAGGYNAQLQTLRAEYSQVLAKGGARSVETDRAASQLIPDGLAPSQLKQVADQIKIDSDNAINEARKQVSGITDQINGIAQGGQANASAPDASQGNPPASGGAASPPPSLPDPMQLR